MRRKQGLPEARVRALCRTLVHAGCGDELGKAQRGLLGIERGQHPERLPPSALKADRRGCRPTRHLPVHHGWPCVCLTLTDYPAQHSNV